MCAHVALVLIWARTCLSSHSDRVHGKCNRCVTAVTDKCFCFLGPGPPALRSCGGGPTYREINLAPPSVLFTNTTEAGTGTEGAEPDEEESTAEGAADWATAEPEPGAEPEYMQYVDWERWDAEQGVPV